MRPIALVRRLISPLLDLVYPRLCALCRARLQGGEHGVCTSCIRPLPLYKAELYHADERLYACPAFGHLYSVFVYRRGADVQRLVHAYKYRGYREVADLVAEMLTRCYDLSGTYDLILAVPLDKERLRTRGYNQALLIARALARHLGIPATDALVLRPAPTETQTQLGKLARMANVQGAFVLAPNARARLTGRRILLVDDVLTTGATLSAIMMLLESAGVVSIDVATAAVATRML